MNRVTLIRNFASLVCGEHVIIARERDEWGMSLAEKTPRLILPKDIMKQDEEDKKFRKFFLTLCPLAWEFSDITISILHEIGHHFHRIEYITCDEDEYNNAFGYDHFKLPCEMIATEWAIKWLQNKDNRAIAKQFNKTFLTRDDNVPLGRPRDLTQL